MTAPASSSQPVRRALFVLGVLLALVLPAARAGAAEPTGQVTWAAAPADTSIGKGRTHYAYTLDPGATLTDAMAIVNRSSTPITLRVYASDAFSTAAGGIDLLPADRKPTDVGSWVTVKSTQVTLKPQQSTVVPFTISVPANATPGDHSGGVVTSLLTRSGDGTVALDRRLGSRLYLRVTGDLKPALGASDVQADFSGTANPAAGGKAAVSYTVTNTGNVRLGAHQRVEIRSPFGVVTTRVQLADLPEVLPGDSLRRTVTVDGVWPSTRLTASVVLDPVLPDGQPPIAVAQTAAAASTWAWPWPQLLAVAVLVLLLVLLRRGRLRQAAKVDAAIAAAVESARSQDANGAESERPATASRS